jgi:hypothetical protein
VLHRGLKRARTSDVEFLVQHGADLGRVFDSDALRLAAAHDPTGVVVAQLLAFSEGCFDNGLERAFVSACLAGNLPAANAVLERLAHIDLATTEKRCFQLIRLYGMAHQKRWFGGSWIIHCAL